MKSILSSAKKLAVIAGFLVAGAAQAASVPYFTTFTDGSLTKLGITEAAHVTYTVLSKDAAYDNVFFISGNKKVQLRVGDSFTLYNVAAGILNFGFGTTTAGADFNWTEAGKWAAWNGNKHIDWTPDSVDGLQQVALGFEDIKMWDGQSDKDFNDLIVSASVSAVPLPGAALLFASSLLGFIGASRRRKV